MKNLMIISSIAMMLLSSCKRKIAVEEITYVYDYRAQSASSHQPSESVLSEQSEILRAYFKKNNMPMAEYSDDFIATAAKYDLDFRIMPALSVNESAGGLNMLYLNNPFGWGVYETDSTKIITTFPSGIPDAIDYVGYNLAGLNPCTRDYYGSEKTLREKLEKYNSVDKNYTDKIFSIMEQICGK